MIIKKTETISHKQNIAVKGEGKSGIGYSEFDMDYCDLQTDINVCEVEQIITSDE